MSTSHDTAIRLVHQAYQREHRVGSLGHVNQENDLCLKESLKKNEFRI
jgi:hypothetical protein